MTLSGGYLTVARVRGVAFRFHVTVPLGLLFLAFVLRDAIVIAGCIGVIIIHELGHAALARRYRLPVVSIDVTPIGGACRYVSAHATETQESIVAWGGVLAQACLLLAGEIVARTIGLSESLLAIHVINLIVIVLNVLPVRPFDGASAWRLFRWKNVRRWGKRGTLHVRAASIEREIGRVKRDEAEAKRRMLN